MMILCILFLLMPLLGQCDLKYPTDCAELYDSGNTVSEVYTIYPHGIDSAVQVYCDMGCKNNNEEGGWTVFQRRLDGTVNFYRPWNRYKEGFGNAAGEYWLGLDLLHLLTSKKMYELKVDMEDFDGNRVFARYSTFSVGSEKEGYKLTVSGFTNGGAGDSLTSHSGSKFSTFDKDQDGHELNCASTFLGGYWYDGCHVSNLNGVYMWGPTTQFAIGVNWHAFKGYHYSLKSTTMKIRPRPLD